MPLFYWIARNQRGELCRGELLALHRNDVCKQLGELQLTEVRYEQFCYSSFTSVSIDEKSRFFYNLSTLMRSGLFLVPSLDLILPNIKNKNVQSVMRDVIFLVQHGLSLSESFSHYPLLFDAITIQMIKAGEESGFFTETLEHVARYWQMRNEFNKKVKSALFGPLVIFIFFLCIFFILLTYIIPSFKKLIDVQSLSLNKLSLFVFGLSDFAANHTIFFIIGHIALLFIILLIIRTKMMRRCIRLLPFIQQLDREVALSSWLTSCSLLLRSGISLASSLDILAGSFGDRLNLKHIAQELQKGIPLSRIMRSHALFPHELCAMIQSAEESGAMAQAMDFAGQLYFEQLVRRLSTVAYIVQPLLIIGLGLVIGIAIIAVYLPLLEVPLAHDTF